MRWLLDTNVVSEADGSEQRDPSYGTSVMLTKSPAATDPALLARFAAIVGEKNAITDPQAQAPYLIEMRDMFPGHTPMVLG